MSAPDTKEKIVQTANKLFYKYGFHGTSVRDIANNANVNIASINYHFGNKENLYLEIFNINFELINKKIEKLKINNPNNTAKFTSDVFKLFLTLGPELINNFKFIMDANLTSKEEIQRCKIIPNGPPGSQALMSVITNELGQDIKQTALEWATHNIFGALVHKAIMLHSSIIKEHISQHHKCNNQEQIQSNFKLYIDAILEFIKNHPEKFN